MNVSRDELLRSARSSRRDQEFELARTYVERGLYHSPGDAELIEEQALIEFCLEHFDKALALFQQRLEVQPDREACWRGKLSCLWRLGHRDRFEAAITESRKACPGSAALRSIEGTLFLQLGRAGEAVESFIASGEINGVLREVQRTNDKNFLAAVEEGFSGHPQVLIAVAKAWKDHNRLDRAGKLAESFYRTGSPHPVVFEIMMSVWEGKNDVEAVGQAIPKLIAAASPAVRFRGADLLCRNGDYEPALVILGAADGIVRLSREKPWSVELIRRGLLWYPDSANLQIELARAQRMTGQVGAAKATYDQLLSQGPKQDEARAEYLELLLKEGALSEAKAIAEASPSNPTRELSLQIARTHEAHGQYRKAGQELFKNAREEWQNAFDRLLKDAPLSAVEQFVESASLPGSAESEALFCWGRLLYEKHGPKEALATFKKAEESANASAKEELAIHAARWVSTCLSQRGRFDEAVAELDRVMKSAAKETQSYLLVDRAFVEMNRDRPREALRFAKEALSLRESDAGREAAVRAKLLLSDAGPPAALEEIKDYRRDSSNPGALQKLEAEVHWLAKSLSEALRCVERASLGPANDKRDLALDLALIELQARILLKLGRRSEAKKAFEAALLNAKTMKAKADLEDAFCYHLLEQGDLPEASKRSAALDKNALPEARHCCRSGAISFYSEEYARAEEQFQRLVELYDSPQATVKLAWTKVRRALAASEEEKDVRKRRLLEAEELCRAAVRIAPLEARGHACLGLTLLTQDRLREAESSLVRSIELDPIDGAYDILGALHQRLGRAEKAEECLKLARTFQPNETQPLLQLAQLYWETGKNDDAAHLLKEATEMAPEESDVTLAYAFVLSRRGSHEQAVAFLQGRLHTSSDPRKTGGIHLALCRALVEWADKVEDTKLYEEALTHAQKAKAKQTGTECDHSLGVVYAKLRQWRQAKAAFERCKKGRPEVERHVERINDLIKSHVDYTAELRLAGRALAAFFGVMIVVVLMLGIFRPAQFGATVLLALLPAFSACLLASPLLPLMSKFKLGGLEAELAKGPTDAQPYKLTTAIGFGAGVAFRPR